MNMKTVRTPASDILTDGELDHASGGWLLAAFLGFSAGFGLGAILADIKPFTATLKAIPDVR